MAISVTEKGTEVSKNSTTLTKTGVSIANGASVIVALAQKEGGLTSGYTVTWNGNSLSQDSTSIVAEGVTIWSLHNVSGDTGSVVVTSGASVSDLAIAVLEATGLASSPLDAAGISASGSGTTPTSQNRTTTQANELLIGAIATVGPDGDNAGSWSNSFTSFGRQGTTGQGATSNITVDGGYRIVSSTGTYTAEKTDITSRNWAANLATYKAADEGPPPEDVFDGKMFQVL